MVLAHMLQREVEIKAPAEKFYEICHTKTQHIANITPEKVQAVKMHEGDWGFAGSIIAWHYTIGKQFKTKIHQLYLSSFNNILFLFLGFS